MDMLDVTLAPVIAAFVAGLLAGSYGERWLLWRRLTEARWIYRRMVWLGFPPREASQAAPRFADLAETLQLRNPLLMAMWLLHAHRRLIALTLLGIIAAAGLALYLK